MNAVSTVSTDRLHGLDALRAFALLLGLSVHGSMAFIPGTQGFWIVHDPASRAGIGLAFYIPHMFRMLLFFLLAGFFGRSLLDRLGTAAFIRDRLRRIVLPFIMFWPLTMAGIVASAVVAQRLGLHTPPPAQGGVPLAHLWFLYDLVLLYAILLGARALCNEVGWYRPVSRMTDRLTHLMTGQAGPFLLACPLAFALALSPVWFLWFGIPTPDMSLLPNMGAATAFASAFTFGWILRPRTAMMERWASDWPLHLTAAVVATAACLSIVGLSPSIGTWSTGEKGFYAVLYATGAWSWTVALTGIALRYASDHSVSRRYLANASYWVYLAHLPLIMFLQAVAVALPAPAWIKFGSVVTITLTMLLAIYQFAVRGTWLGRLLGEKRLRDVRNDAI